MMDDIEKFIEMTDDPTGKVIEAAELLSFINSRLKNTNNEETRTELLGIIGIIKSHMKTIDLNYLYQEQRRKLNSSMTIPEAEKNFQLAKKLMLEIINNRSRFP